MKTLLLALLVTFPVFAETTCFVRNTELATHEVKLARELCFGAVELELDVFATSQALVRFSLDGQRAFKKIELRNGRDLGNGTLAFAFVVENNWAGGQCGDTWNATSTGTILVKRDGSQAQVKEVSAELTFSNDNCHSSEQTVQEFNYDRI